MKLDTYILPPETAEIYFDYIPAILSSNVRHFGENLGHGKCEFVFHDQETWALFHKYNLTTIRAEKYPAIVNFAGHWLYGSWYDDTKDASELPQGVECLGDGQYEIEIGNASDISKLYADPEFKKLNARYAEEAKARTAQILKGLEKSESDDLKSFAWEYPELKDSDLESLGKKAGALKISEDSLGNSSEEERKTPPNSAQILKESETNGLKNQSSNVLDSSESFSLNVLEDTPRAVRAGGESNSPANSSSNGPERTSNPISPVSSDGEKVEDF